MVALVVTLPRLLANFVQLSGRVDFGFGAQIGVAVDWRRGTLGKHWLHLAQSKNTGKITVLKFGQTIEFEFVHTECGGSFGEHDPQVLFAEPVVGQAPVKY
ncbi:hypothetical protein BpHYR1_011280 [Brachionus plicatilis]|uniref:Uncharacterized protein n=1 Tax=Brachionus plicatilis TaxID=10195 RepID=A0A3M7QSA8_BRAPC|nr:hypothetical protein BpHYR1_011280 [Brachionus plicatilis]